MMTIRPQTMRNYRTLYPSLTDKEIVQGIRAFEKKLSEEGNIDEHSTNFTKYLRGWLMCLNAIKEENESRRTEII